MLSSGFMLAGVGNGKNRDSESNRRRKRRQNDIDLQAANGLGGLVGVSLRSEFVQVRGVGGVLCSICPVGGFLRMGIGCAGGIGAATQHGGGWCFVFHGLMRGDMVYGGGSNNVGEKVRHGRLFVFLASHNVV